MTTPDDYRAMISELADQLDLYRRCLLDNNRATHPLVDRARALLAAPEAVGVTDEPPPKDAPCWYNSDMASAWEAGRTDGWTDAHLAPVPVGERLPGVGDCDAEGYCWFWDYGWTRQRRGWHDNECTHWLPHWALPLPEAQP
jgi:hypothetical protein